MLGLVVLRFRWSLMLGCGRLLGVGQFVGVGQCVACLLVVARTVSVSQSVGIFRFTADVGMSLPEASYRPRLMSFFLATKQL